MSLRTAVCSKLHHLIKSAVRNHGGVFRPMTIISKSSAEEYKKQNYTARMNKTGRPVSPHVQIYSFPIAALSSITVRITGMMLSIGAFGLGAIDLVGGSGAALSMMESIGSQGILVTAPAKLAVAFPIVYHTVGGLRHFVWDYFPDKFLNNDDVPKSSFVIIGSSAVISLGLMFA
jgi:succinate dehydrogenase (ubiquinone) cytochrome b560 subunit